MATNPKGLDPRAARLGEIVEASTTVWRAVAPRTFEAPAFGSFVKTSDGSRTTYGVVSHVQPASIDPSRKAIPLPRSIRWRPPSRSAAGTTCPASARPCTC